METQLIKKAYNFAKIKHDGQTRDDGTNYIVHPLNVSKIIENYIKDDKLETLIIASLLHDTLEDTNTTFEEIEKNFGKEAANLVLELTSSFDEVKKVGKEKYLSKKMVEMSNDALIIKLADRLNNVSDLKTSNADKRKRYLIETKNILNYLIANRELLKTQQSLVNAIFKEMESYKNLERI